MTDFLALALHSGWTFFGTLILLPVLTFCFWCAIHDTADAVAKVIKAIRETK